jgi:hypothetical protein
MSSSEAQKSPVHHATEDSSVEPTNETRQPGNVAPGPADRTEGAARPGSNATDRRRDPDNDPDLQPPNVIGGGPGAGDASSGGGAGAGTPGGGTDMRTDGAFSGGDVEEDRKKLFPEARTHRGDDDTKVGEDRDESSYGGPLNLDDPDAV